jgi:hypothetical protein
VRNTGTFGEKATSKVDDEETGENRGRNHHGTRDLRTPRRDLEVTPRQLRDAPPIKVLPTPLWPIQNGKNMTRSVMFFPWREAPCSPPVLPGCFVSTFEVPFPETSLSSSRVTFTTQTSLSGKTLLLRLNLSPKVRELTNLS